MARDDCGKGGQSKTSDFTVSLHKNGYRSVSSLDKICLQKRRRLEEHFVKDNLPIGEKYHKELTRTVCNDASLQAAHLNTNGNGLNYLQDPTDAPEVFTIRAVSGHRTVSSKQVTNGTCKLPDCIAEPIDLQPDVLIPQACGAAETQTLDSDGLFHQECQRRYVACGSSKVSSKQLVGCTRPLPEIASSHTKSPEPSLENPRRQCTADVNGILAKPLNQSAEGADDSNSWPDVLHIEPSSPVTEGITPAVPNCNTSSTTRPCCQLPYNGHREDLNHYGECPIILNGFILRGEHTTWLNTIPDSDSVTNLINLVIGSSCRDILLKSKCTKNDCSHGHTINLNFNLPSTLTNTVFDIFMKWFLQNATHPDFRALLQLHSQLPKNHNNVLMRILSFIMMVVKLPNKSFRHALFINLVQVMINAVGMKPEEAVRTCLMFAVSPDSEQTDIMDLLNDLEISKKLINSLYQSISCLWHLNNTFSCPRSLLLDILNECCDEMPVDLKLTKDRIVFDLLKLPRSVLREKYVLIDKFLSKFYPMNSEVVAMFKTSVLYGQISELGSKKSCRVKPLGQVNPKWDHWSIHDERVKGFQLVLKQSQKKQSHKKSTKFRQMTELIYGDDFNEEMSRDDVLKLLQVRNLLWCQNSPLSNSQEPDDSDALGKALHLSKLNEVVEIIASYDQLNKANSLHLCMHTLQQELTHYNKNELHRIAQDILQRLPGSLADECSIKSNFVCVLNSLVMHFYQNEDYFTAIKLVKTMRGAGVNHLEHVPRGIDPAIFTIMNSDMHFKTRLYREAVRTLKCKNSLVFLRHVFDGVFTVQYFYSEFVVTGMLSRFLRERCAVQAMSIFWLILKAQKDLYYPINLGKFYEGVVFLSFVKDLKKNSCAPGDGAMLYVTVDRISGNTVPFHSITYRSLLVELHRVNAPTDVIRRLLWICLSKKIYPDFSAGPVSPLVLGSHLAQEEMSIYLKNYFAFSAAQKAEVTPLVVKFFECLPGPKPFPVANDIMKTPRSVPEALKRLQSALGDIDEQLGAEFSSDSVTIPQDAVQKLLNAFQV